MSVKTLYMYDLINGIYHVSMATILLTFVISLVCLMGILIKSQSDDNFSFKEALNKHKKSILKLSILIVVSLFVIIATPSEATINAYFGADVIKLIGKGK